MKHINHLLFILCLFGLSIAHTDVSYSDSQKFKSGGVVAKYTCITCSDALNTPGVTIDGLVFSRYTNTKGRGVVEPKGKNLFFVTK